MGFSLRIVQPPDGPAFCCVSPSITARTAATDGTVSVYCLPYATVAWSISHGRHAVWANRLAQRPELALLAALLAEMRTLRACLEGDQPPHPEADGDDAERING
jgi:hypothetical protein